MMNEEDYFEFKNTIARMQDLISIGVITELDDSLQRAKVKIRGEPTGFLPIAQARASGDEATWPYDVGEQVVVLAPGGEIEGGFIVCALPSAKSKEREKGKRRVTFQDGTVVEYDRQAHAMKIALVKDGLLSIRIGEATIEATSSSLAIKGKAMTVEGTEVELKAENVKVTAKTISFNDKGAPCGVVTTESICAFTGLPHPDGSLSVKAGK